MSLPGFELIRHDRTSKRGGGVAIYLRTGIAYKLLHKSHNNANAEFLFLEIDNRAGVKFAFGVVYNPPGNSRLEPLYKCLKSLANDFDDCIFTGDFNINFLLSTPPVLRFKNLMQSINLSCPLSSPTNFVTNCQPSLIDLILIKNSDGLRKFKQTSIGSFTSHHAIIGSYAISMAAGIKPVIRYYRNVNKVNASDLIRFSASLDWDLIFSMPQVDEQVKHLNSLLLLLIDKFAPLRKITLSNLHLCPDWFTTELRRLINLRNFHHPAAQRERDCLLIENHKSEYRRLRNQVTTLKRNLKAKCYSKFLDLNLPGDKFWRRIKDLGITQKPPNPAENFSPQEFNDYFASVFSPSTQSVQFDNDDYNDNDFDFSAVTNTEVDIAITAIKTNAIGDDGIPASFLKKLCPFITPFLTHVINNCIMKSYFPVAWKIAIVNPILKVTCPSELSEFRPISILPCLSKVLERLMKTSFKTSYWKINY